MKKQKIQVYDDDFCRIDVWLHRNFPDISRSVFTTLIKQGFVQKNRKILYKPSSAVHPGDILEITWPVNSHHLVEPQNLPIHILYQDEHIIVVNKKAGMIVHPVRPFQKGTLVNGLLFMGMNLSRYGSPLRPGIVHRLDRDTSGTMVIAKTDRAYLELIRMFKKRDVEKLYLAIVEGRWIEKKYIDLAIQRNPHLPYRMQASPLHGKPAFTEIEVIQGHDQYSFLAVKPKTGRTHQIRVHLSAQGFPIAGDSQYGSRYSEKIIQRQALHAFVLSFPHPITQKKMFFVATLPDDFRSALKVF